VIKSHSSEGFSFMEVMIVISVLGIIASIAIPNYRASVETAHATACLGERKLTDKMIVFYMSENPATPLTSLSQLVSGGYMEETPICPYGGEYLLIPEGQNQGIPAVGCSLHFWPGSGDEGDASDSLLASDNFENGDAGGWTETGRDWEVVDGQYIGGKERGSAYRNYTFFGDGGWTDYTVELDANLMNGQGSAYGYGVFFRAQDYLNLDSYIFQYDAGYGENGAFLFREIVDGREQSPFARVDAPEGYVWNGTEKHITITVSGDNFSAYVSDVNGGTIPVLEGSDSSYATGAIGLRTWGSAQAGFDNIEVSQN
jgi:prepilin-type N-terminal cleavage/methylation domain-containing protein